MKEQKITASDVPYNFDPKCSACKKSLDWHKYRGCYVCYTGECEENGNCYDLYFTFKEIQNMETVKHG